MRFFRTEPPTPAQPPVVREKPASSSVKSPAAKVPAIEGWSENELAAVYAAATARDLMKGEAVFTETDQTDSFFLLLRGVIQINVKLNGQPGRSGVYQRGDCVAPLQPLDGLSYNAEAISDCSVIEIPTAILKSLPDNLQVCVYKAATASTGAMQSQIRSINGDLSSKNLRLSQYILNQYAAGTASVRSEFVQTVIANMRSLPVYVTDLASKLLDETTSVQEVVEGIRSDPSLVATVLRTVNSAQYGFDKKIESFYHACMILGFNNIYSLLIREAALNTMPITRETTRIHRHSSLISVLCFEIVSITEQQAQTAATIGILHDVGKSVRAVMRSTHPAKADFIDTLDASRLGATLLRAWNVPERICKVVEFQHHAEFMAPELVAPEFRSEIAGLHIAHVLETLLLEKSLDPSRNIYTSDYMEVLGFGNKTPGELLRDRILPSLRKNKVRVPPELHNLVLKPIPVLP